MHNALIYVFSFAFVLGALIFVHELGHFLVAKFFKVRVLTFSLGFGKRVVGFKRGETDYRLSLLPFGGYVKMAGELPADETVGDPDEFMSKPRWQRLCIGAAGATMNLVGAVVILAVVLKVNHREPEYLSRPVVVGVLTASSPAAAAGIQVGDRVVRMENKENPSWQDVETLSITNHQEPVALTVDRNHQTLQFSFQPKVLTLPETGEQISDLGIQPAIPVQVRSLAPGFPAAAAGIQEGDLILKIGDHPITQAEDFKFLNDTIHKSVGNPLTFLFKRGEETFTKEITPVFDPSLGMGRIGFRPDIPTVRIDLSLFGALEKSVSENLRFTQLTFKVLGHLITGKTSTKTLVGPIGIFRVTGEVAKTSAIDLFRWMAFISLQLGIFNLLPIPVLDGGMIFMLLIESILRRDMSRIAKERLIQVGFVFLMLLMGYVIYNDAMRYLPWGKPAPAADTPTETPAR